MHGLCFAAESHMLHVSHVRYRWLWYQKSCLLHVYPAIHNCNLHCRIALKNYRIELHCREARYALQIAICNLSTCLSCKPFVVWIMQGSIPTHVLVEPTTSEIQKKFVYLPCSFNCANTVVNNIEISPASPAHSSIIGRVSNVYTEQAKVSFLLPKTLCVSINGKSKIKINLTETQSNRECS